jgi:two-component system NtrC family sensor kinase
MLHFPEPSLRTKLILSFLIVIIIGGLITLSLGQKLIKNTLVGQAQKKVNYDLASAWIVFNERLNDIKALVSLTAAREGLQESVVKGEQDLILRRLDRVRVAYGLDILTLTDPQGRVTVRTRNPEMIGDDQSPDDLVRLALQGSVVAYPEIVPRSELLREGEDLADQAYMEFIPTPKAAPRLENKETSGLMLKAAAPLSDEKQGILGVLYGGILLNRNYEIVDRVKETVFRGEKYKGRETGTATIFQGDLRISTNVTTERGERAIGTRLSAEVNTAVLKEGRAWNDRAFVVRDWYITAYEPIRNSSDQIIGILYVGTLERPYIDTAKRVMFTFALMASLCVLFLLIILYFSTTRIIKPLQGMVAATHQISNGDLNHKVEIHSQDEIGQLAAAFNQMTEKLKAANKELVDWGTTLEKKVAERTKELVEMQARLIQSEKLASLGKLAAGIAHEINNPLGGVLIYTHLLLEDTDKDSGQYENLKKIVKETTRCKDIVKGLLEFSRPKEPEMVPTDIHEAINRALAIFEPQALFQNIQVQKEFSEVPRIIADSSQLQQVFTNIIANAAEAMAGSGILTIRTSLEKQTGRIKIELSDTGHGIKPENMTRLFEPFFTTKEVGKGTGLGLAISYGIVQKHQGSIEVRSEIGKGTTFTVILPVKRNLSGE